eukprot:TRINITY_DN3610_c0_g3_i1.p1 TRINITY_DN3610_c0_g3~~TRINITY_DN3610_c0_g3_i1.p1  ORF type:complete len:555 (-),score=64.91 TRINITY_DN3610_c0_g3_i1:1482-3119(-)
MSKNLKSEEKSTPLIDWLSKIPTYLLFIFLAYSTVSTLYTFVGLYFPDTCAVDRTSYQHCIVPLFNYSNRYDLHLVTSKKGGYWEKKNIFWSKLNISLEDPIKEVIKVPLFPDTRQNGTIFMSTLLTPTGVPPDDVLNEKASLKGTKAVVQLTRYLPVAERREYLLHTSNEKYTFEPGQIVTHWKPRVTLRYIVDNRFYDHKTIPRDMSWEVQTIDKQQMYRPIVYVDEMHLLKHHLSPLSTNTSFEHPSIVFQYQPTSIGTHRLFQVIKSSLSTMKQMGMSDDEIDQVLILISPDRLYQLLITYLISILHIVLSFLAFKNEIGFWKGREHVAGISQTATIGNAVCSLIIFLFLFDSVGTSWLVLGTTGVSALIDIWKVTKVLKIDLLLRKKPKDEQELKTDGYDATGMKYLSYVLYPLVLGWAVYSLIYEPHKSWWSWFIGSAAKGVYAFGFLMMTPQIFINYKLKSVAHMPWRAMTYKVFNTFVDDLFAWMIEMPTVHRLATLRDDLVFFIYLYQMWIYPVDKNRPNEFGYVYTDEDDKKKTE